MRKHVLARLVMVVVGVLWFAGSARAQFPCPDPQWLPGEGLPGTSGPVYATTMWDPDGPGPAKPKLVIGGVFTIAGTVAADRIAAFDPDTGEWSALGTGMNASVRALTTLPNGDLVAGGFFTNAGGVSANHIARWNGTSWSALGTGMSSVVYALTTLPNGDLVAGGEFTTAGGVLSNRIARWDGTFWWTMGTGVSGGQVPNAVYTLSALPNGDLVAGGYFTTAGGVSANYIARWDGTSWSALGSGMSSLTNSASVHALTTLPNGDLVAGGYFTTAGGVSANHIARWDGTSWSALGSGMSSLTNSASVHALTTLPNGDLVAGGSFTKAGGVDLSSIGRWNSTIWSALGTGMNSEVSGLTTLPNGDLVAGGAFTSAGGVSANRIARWDGTSWSALGTGMSGSLNGPPTVYALATLPNGNLVAGGDFTTAGGISASRIARWDGTSWWALGSGMSDEVSALVRLPNGDLVAGGRFYLAGGVLSNRIARWDGTFWWTMGTGVRDGKVGTAVYTLSALPNGDLVAGGDFTTAGGVSANRIARWDGTSWSALGTGMNSVVSALTMLPNGDLVAGGWFKTAGGVSANRIARWNGTGWSALGAGMNERVYALTTLPNGDLVAGGNFWTAGGVSAIRIARWNGSGWSALGSGMNSLVYALTTLPNGDLVVGGEFLTAGGVVAPYIARLGCPPAPCYADCDTSGTLNIFDYICFSNAYGAQEPYADCDMNGVLNIFDYSCFSDAYAAGCP